MLIDQARIIDSGIAAQVVVTALTHTCDASGRFYASLGALKIFCLCKQVANVVCDSSNRGFSMKKTLAFCVAALVIAGCTTTEKVAAVQPMDATLTCDQLTAEFAKLDSINKTADSNKGVNTANVAAVLLFWPAAVGNYMDADSAQKLVNERRTHLMGIWNSKNCVGAAK